jgi:cholest-4-en-3-one 26-monooxygenase
VPLIEEQLEGVLTMSTDKAPATAQPADDVPLDQILLCDLEHWQDGPPHELFARMRRKCPLHWTPRFSEYPDEDGFWSVTTAEDVQQVSLDWQTYSSELGGIIALKNAIMPLQLQQAMFVGMDPPKHDRIKALFQRGFSPRRIAEHEDRIRAITRETLDLLEGPPAREQCDVVSDIAQPVVARVIGSFMGISPEDDQVWTDLNSTLMVGDSDVNPEGTDAVTARSIPQIFAICQKLIAERRENPTEDLTSVLVHAEIDGERLEEHEIIMGFFLLISAGNDSTKATYCSGMRALLEDEEQRQLVLEDPALIPDAVEESLRMFPAFCHFARTATQDVELHGQQIKAGEKVVMWYPSSNRDEACYEDPNRFDLRRKTEHQAFGGGGRHYCLGSALARLELRILIEETLARYPRMQISGQPRYVESRFANQLKTLPVTLNR